jgi:UDP-N-acetylglucosamine 2-epimerase (non-hydrolysing)
VVGALIGRWLGASVGHIEAGLRSGKLLHPFPEELDRRITGRLADIHFAPGREAIANLEGARGTVVDTTYNTVLDSLRLVPAAVDVGLGTLPPRFGVVSLHRFELTRNRRRLTGVFEALARRAADVPVFAVTDPLVSASLREHGLEELFDSQSLIRLPKLPYQQFVALLREASFVVTDSGGLQEECAYLDVPCLVHRATSERQDGIGRNVVVSGLDLNVLERFLDDPEGVRAGRIPDGSSPAGVIVEHLGRSGYLRLPEDPDILLTERCSPPAADVVDVVLAGEPGDRPLE